MSEAGWMYDWEMCQEAEEDARAADDVAYRNHALHLYRKNEKALIGEAIDCPICGKRFWKVTKSQKFCNVKRPGHSTCKDQYHNLMSEERASYGRFA
jgi:hypothetical protein